MGAGSGTWSGSSREKTSLWPPASRPRRDAGGGLCPLSACDAAVAPRGGELRAQPHRVDGSGAAGRGVPQPPSAVAAAAAAATAVTAIADVLVERLGGGVPGHVATAVGARPRRLDAQRVVVPRVARPSDRAVVAAAAAARRLAADAARGLDGAVPGVAWTPRGQRAARLGARLGPCSPQGGARH